jgi:hypothetical protein
MIDDHSTKQIFFLQMTSDDVAAEAAISLDLAKFPPKRTPSLAE